MYAIEAEGLVKRFGATTALDGVDLFARSGTVLGVLGPNGAGKTTAVRVLATLLRPDAGSARVAGFDVVRQAHEVRGVVGLTGQYAAVDEELTGTQNLLLVGRLLGLSRRDARRRSAELLERFGLADAGGRRAKTYSGGMRRRLDLAVSLVGRPGVLYLDEPTTGLDPHSRNELWGIVRGLVADGSTVLLTTQYMDEADQLADDIAVIDHGKVIATGSPDELKAKTGGQTLEIRPADPDAVERVAVVVAELTGVAPTVRGQRLSAPVADPAVPAAVLRRLDEVGVPVLELALRLPSLDDVFLSLTGHATGDANGNGTGRVS
ncbi:ATP-binding cassette domain-containing protein [Actinocatenispora rupis]|uniref:Daunorubicin resistance protein DrrA family ABC transporter ATP-binding protein n=1 Tax=Actinocatenispora rupis TaxID=519421 RepID=A0A8J3IZP4_9ACTN|nr:ATP-binding cassette domain-containing protein [Actinocatenispora rupis]GID09355.1 daunorubicin resistance protein DrrA family ABC transporter ATP-binding protein [Actinocatenispora rupis]